MTATLALAAISAAALAYEVLLIRLFAIVQWHQFAVLAISVALLGFGLSATLLVICRHRIGSRSSALFAAGTLGFAITAPLSFLACQALPFNALAIPYNPSQLLYLALMIIMPSEANIDQPSSKIVQDNLDRFGDDLGQGVKRAQAHPQAVSYTHLRAHET